jgi:hypothetical protein
MELGFDVGVPCVHTGPGRAEGFASRRCPFSFCRIVAFPPTCRCKVVAGREARGSKCGSCQRLRSALLVKRHDEFTTRCSDPKATLASVLGLHLLVLVHQVLIGWPWGRHSRPPLPRSERSVGRGTAPPIWRSRHALAERDIAEPIDSRRERFCLAAGCLLKGKQVKLEGLLIRYYVM